INPSILRWSLGETQSSGSNSPDAVSPRGTCAAIRTGKSETWKDWIALTPDTPAISVFQFRSRPTPRGVTSPIPVTTTRRILHSPAVEAAIAHARATSIKRGESSGRSEGSAVRFNKADRILDRYDLLGGGIRDFAPELLLKGHNELHGIEAVGAQIVDEASVFGHLRLVDAQMLDHDLFDPISDVTHPFFSSVAWWNFVYAQSTMARSAITGCSLRHRVERVSHGTVT